MATKVTPLFESFSILVLACKNNEEKPSLVYKWQFLSLNNNPDATTVEQISQFCFPDDLSFQAQFYPGMSESTQNDPKTENFAFVMTDSDGTKKIGICRRRVEPLVAKCYCFISKHPYFELFERLLSAFEAQQKLVVSETAFKTMLEHCLQESEIPVTKQVSKKKPQNVTLNFFNTSHTIPIGHGLSEFGDISLLPLLSCLSYKNISRVFASVFSERRIIFSSSDLGKLSYAAMGVYSLLYPFAWHYIFIPVLPAPLLHYCCAPMPFIVGIHTSSLDELAKMPLEEIVFVYLDDNKVVSGAAEDDLEMLPNNWGHTKTGIKQFLASGKKSGVYDNKIVTDSFTTIFTGIFGKSKNYLVSNSGKMSMDRSAFEQSIPKGCTKFFNVFKESQIFEQFVRALQENRPNLEAFDELCIAYEKKQQSLLEASQNQESLGSFLDDNLKSLWDTGKSSILGLFSNKETKKVETKPTKEEKQQPISVHSAIKNILEQQYKNRETMHLPPRQHRANTIHNTVELATAFESGEDKSAGLIMGQVAIEELRKRLSHIHRQSMMINPNQQQQISSNPKKMPIKKDYSLPEIPKKTYFQAKAERKEAKPKIHVDTLDTPKPKPNVDVIGLETKPASKPHPPLGTAKSFIDFGSKPKPLPPNPPPLSTSLDSVRPIPPRMLDVNKRGSLPEEPPSKPQRSFMRPLPVAPVQEEPVAKRPIQKANSTRPLPKPPASFTLRSGKSQGKSDFIPQSQNRSRATIAPEMDEHAHMTDAHISRFPSREVPKSNTKKLMMKLQLQMDSKPKESVSAPTTPTNNKADANAELMKKLQRRRELGGSDE